jgi:hypothetical protein
MQSLKTFFRTLILSSISPSYYRDLRNVSKGFSIKYLLGFQALATMVIVASFSALLLEFDPNALRSSIVQAVPSNLILKLENGRLTINQPLPYALEVPVEENSMELDKLIVFESDSNMKALSDVKNWNAAVVLTETTMYARGDRPGEMRVFEFPVTEEKVELSKTTVEEFAQKIFDHPFIKNKWYVPTILVLVGVMMYPMLLIATLFTLLVYSLISWLVAKVFFSKAQLSYGTMYRLGIHALTPVIILSAVVQATGYGEIRGIWYFALYLIWITLGVMQIAKPVEIVVASKPKTKRKKS